MSFIDSVTPWLGAATSALGIGSGISSLFGSSPDYEEIAEQNRDWQSEENQKNRDWQSSEWTRQFDAVNSYNDPSKQRARLSKAGFNPAVAFAEGAGAIGQSTSSASAPSGASGSVTTSFPDSLINRDFVAADTMSRSLKTLSEIGTDVVNRDYLRELANKAVGETSLLSVKKDMAEFDRDIQQIYGESLKNAQVQKAVAEYYNILADTKLKGSQINETDATALMKASETLLNIARKHLTDSEYHLAEKQLRWYDREMASIIAKNNASARESNAAAKNVEFWNKLNSDERAYLVKNVHNDAAKRYNDAKISERQFSLLQYAIEQAHFSTDTQEIKFWNELIMSDLKGASDVVSDWTKVGIFKGMEKNQRDRILQKEREFDQRQREFNSVEKTEEYKLYDSDGVHTSRVKYRE